MINEMILLVVIFAPTIALGIWTILFEKYPEEMK